METSNSTKTRSTPLKRIWVYTCIFCDQFLLRKSGHSATRVTLSGEQFDNYDHLIHESEKEKPAEIQENPADKPKMCMADFNE